MGELDISPVDYKLCTYTHADQILYLEPNPMLLFIDLFGLYIFFVCLRSGNFPSFLFAAQLDKTKKPSQYLI